jgi:hypothetical protein
MTKRQAESQGLVMTGIYERSYNKDKVKERIEKERKERPGCRIVMVFEPDSKYSRGGGGGGYAAFADKVYFAYEELERTNLILNRHQNVVNALKAEYEKKLADAEVIRQNASDRFDKAVATIEEATGKPLTTV